MADNVVCGRLRSAPGVRLERQRSRAARGTVALRTRTTRPWHTVTAAHDHRAWPLGNVAGDGAAARPGAADPGPTPGPATPQHGADHARHQAACGVGRLNRVAPALRQEPRRDDGR